MTTATHVVAFLGTLSTLETATTNVAKDQATPTMHGITTTRLFDPIRTFRALFEFLFGGKFLKGGVHIVAAAVFLRILFVAFVQFLASLKLFASHPTMPRSGATHQTVRLVTKGTVQLAVAFVPLKQKRTPRCRATPHILGGVDQPVHAQSEEAIAIFLR